MGNELTEEQKQYVWSRIWIDGVKGEVNVRKSNNNVYE